MQSSFLFGGYATPTKCVAFWRLALHSYNILSVKQPITLLSEKPCDNNSVKQNRCLAHFNAQTQVMVYGIELTGDTPRLDLTEMAMPMVMRKSLAKYMGI